jgi:transcriptional regulator with XRE-family HTH domain
MKIKTARENAGLSQTELALKAGLNPSLVNRIERGVRPNRRTAERLAKALGVDIEVVFPNAAKLRKY